MSEIIFPLLGTVIVVLLVLPTSAILVKGGLMLLEHSTWGTQRDNLALRYLLLTGASVLPLAWLVSAGLHQAESGRSALACILDHDATDSCLESGYFALALGLVVLISSLRALGRATFRVQPVVANQSLHRRVESIIDESPSLMALKHRVHIIEDSHFALGTIGLFRPRVLVGSHFVSLLSDEMLRSALAHELEHVRTLDPLRYWMLQVALAINPLGRSLLEPHAASWLAAREVHCDREAVLRGALPLSLANAIIVAARPGPHVAVALGTRDTSLLKHRVELLLAFAETSPTPCGTRVPSTIPVALALLVLTLILPHQTTTEPLDALHAGAERTVAFFSP